MVMISHSAIVHHAPAKVFATAADPHKQLEWDPGTLTTVDRYALIQRHNGSEGDGAEMLTPAAEYLRTLTTKGHQSLITAGDIAAAEVQVDDCLFRMLEPHEVAARTAPHDQLAEVLRGLQARVRAQRELALQRLDAPGGQLDVFGAQ